jgi:hypothetical protein
VRRLALRFWLFEKEKKSGPVKQPFSCNSRRSVGKCPVGACVDGDVAVAIYGPQGREGTRSPKISFAAKARIASAPANSRWTSLTKASGSKVAIQASISWPLQAARWRAMAGGRSLVISLGMAGSIKFGEKRCGSVVTPAGSPT